MAVLLCLLQEGHLVGLIHGLLRIEGFLVEELQVARLEVVHGQVAKDRDGLLNTQPAGSQPRRQAPQRR